jgi:hypothetical protein
LRGKFFYLIFEVSKQLNMATKSQEIRTAFGLLIYKGDYEGAQWSITGFPKDEQLARHFESAYDFEDCIKRNVNCSGIEFDSEFSQFFAYAKTKARLVSFAKQIEKHFAKAKAMTEKMY